MTMSIHTPPVRHILRDSSYKRGLHAFQGGKVHHGRFGTHYDKNGGRGGGSNRGRASPGDVALGHALRWRCRSRLAIAQAAEEIIGGIVVVCAAFGLTESEGKTEIMCLRTKRMPESTVIFHVEAVGQVYNQRNKFAYLGGNANHNNANLSIEVDWHIRSAWCSFRKYTLKLYD